MSSDDLERIYTINLGKVLLSQSQHRAVRAINMIREFARHHMNTEVIKIEEDLAQLIWAKGVRHPPRKIRVRMSMTDDGNVLVSPYDVELEAKLSADTKDAQKSLESSNKPVDPYISSVSAEEAAARGLTVTDDIIDDTKDDDTTQAPNQIVEQGDDDVDDDDVIEDEDVIKEDDNVTTADTTTTTTTTTIPDTESPDTNNSIKDSDPQDQKS